jgi:methylmalonyl-CoA mutase N-terminal domain/subunit
MSSNRKFETTSGIRLDPFFGPRHLEDFDYRRDLGDPGNYPFTRGVRPGMYRDRLWTMRQYAGFGSARESNARYKYLLGLGQTGLSVAFDLPTQMGMDSDAAMAAGEVGRTGVAIDSLGDMEELFRGIPLDRVSVSMTINATAAVLLALLVALARSRQVPPEHLSGTIQNDILKEYIARGTYIYPPEASMRLVTDLIGYCSRNLPQWNPISVSGYHIREAGSSAVQELAFTLGNAIAYVEACLKSGLAIDAFAPRISFFFNVHNHFLEEVAKFRAARRMWSRIMKERFGARNPRSWVLRFHAQTAGSTLTAQQPEVNTVRVTLQALAAVLGGTQSLHTNSRDEALSLPTKEAAGLALQTQQVIAYESGLAEVADPLAGSFAVEALTDALEKGAREYLARIEAMGGMMQAISQGFVQREIQESSYRYQRSVESGESTIVGVNRFVSEDRPGIRIHQIDPGVEREQRQRLARVRASRDSRAAGRALDAIAEAAGTGENLLPAMIRAVECQVTLGEISDRLRTLFGEHQENLQI